VKTIKIISAVAMVVAAVLFLELGCASLFVPHVTPVLTTNAVSGLVLTNYVTNYTVSAGVTNAVGTTQQLTKDLPYGTLVNGALGLAIAVLAAIAKMKSDKASIVPTLIAAVEAAPNNDELKTSIKRIASHTGVEQRLNREVRRFTAAKTGMDFGKKP
jgi:hypothetical protein